MGQGASTLRLLIGKNRELRQAATDAGGKPEWLRSAGVLTNLSPAKGLSFISRKPKAP